MPHKDKENRTEDIQEEKSDTFFVAEKLEGFLTEERRNLHVQHTKRGCQKEGRDTPRMEPRKERL